MKYSSKDRLQDFEFHDAVLSLISWDDQCLIVSAKYLNVHKDAAPDNAGADMEIAEARITFYGIQVREFEPGRAFEYDKNGNSYTNDPLIIHTDSIAKDMFENELRGSVCVYGIDPDNGVYELGAAGIEPYFSVRFTFSSVKIEWDDYRKKAWYELHKYYKKQITLSTPDGETELDAHINCHAEDESSFDKSNAESPSVLVSIKYAGKDIVGRGQDHLWIDAFLDLQRKLPSNVKLKCCLTCRHGNMCPVGNEPGELFCTKDVKIQQKSDLFFYTEDASEREKRSRDYTDVCENYEEQSKDYYTYNDYCDYWF